MPDGLPNNLYTGGAVTFNSQPYTQFYLQSQARKRAKDEALTKYFADFTKSVNPAGMRTQDINEGWMQKRNDWEKYYMDNIDKIKNVKLDNGKAYGEFMGRYQDLLNDTQRSKNEVDTRKQVMPIISDPEKRQRLTNSFLGNLHNSDYSIYDKRYVPLDISTIDYNPKELDAKDLEGFKNSFWSGLKQSDSMPTVQIDPKTKSKFSSKTTDFNKDALSVATHNAETLYNTNSVFQHFIDNLDTPEHFDAYNKIFKEHYGHDLDMKHPEEMAAAYALSVKPSPVTETALQGYSEYNPYVMEALREKYFDYSQTQQQDKLNTTIDALVDQQIAEAKQGTMWGAPSVLSVDPATLKALGISQAMLSPDGQKVIPVTNLITGTDPKTGQQIVTPTNGTPITIDQWKAAMGKRNVGAKYFQKQEPSSTTKVKKSKTKDSLEIMDLLKQHQ